MSDPSLDVLVNLTPPSEHLRVNTAALESNKHLFTEKPLATNRADGSTIVALARQKRLLVACAPDTFLAPVFRQAKKLIIDGAIGRPIVGLAFMLRLGVEQWHPRPDFLFREGAGPLLDMGPYHLALLISLLGPVRQVTALAKTSFELRTVVSSSGKNRTIPVEVPTHWSASLECENGCVVTLVTSFDMWSSRIPPLEIHGTDGALALPDPNQYGGQLRLRSGRNGEWRPVDLPPTSSPNGRGLGLSDLITAIEHHRPPRASASLALHVLDVMDSLATAVIEQKHVTVNANLTD